MRERILQSVVFLGAESSCVLVCISGEVALTLQKLGPIGPFRESELGLGAGKREQKRKTFDII